MTHADTYEKGALFTPRRIRTRMQQINTHPSLGVKRNIWEKSWRSWVHMLENDIEKYDFFMKTDSDSFVAVENMKT